MTAPMRRREWLASLALASSWPGLPRAQAADDERVRRGHALRFPRDHGSHLGAAIEWWYITGALQGPADQRLGFQITFFRSRTGLAEGLDSRFAARHLLFAHAALTDLGRTQHLHEQRIARWSGDETSGLARASLRDTDVRLGGWSLQRRDADGRSLYVARFGSRGSAGPSQAPWLHAGGTEAATRQTRGNTFSGAAAQDFWLDLELRATQPVLLQGDAGFSRKGPDEAQASHYLSEPQLSAQGVLTRARQRSVVSGRAWLDHEWSEQLLHPEAVGWDWIGMNLDDGAALTAFCLRRADGSSLWAGGSLRTAGGVLQVFAADSVRFTPGRLWSSPSSGARYPLQWQIDTPAGRFGVRALLDAQELDSRASTGTVYWEGLSELLDTQQRRIGKGYLEMTGYAGRLRLAG